MTCAPAGMSLTAELDRLEGVTEGRMRDRCVEAQQLLHGRRDVVRLGAQLRELVGLVQERDDGVADEARGRVVAGHDQLEDRRQQLPVVELFVAVAGCDERADRGRRPGRRACPDDPAQTSTTLSEACLGSQRTPPGSMSRTSMATRPLPKVAALACTGMPRSSQITVNGNGNAKRRHQVDGRFGVATGDDVEQVVDDDLDPWPQVLDGTAARTPTTPDAAAGCGPVGRPRACAARSPAPADLRRRPRHPGPARRACPWRSAGPSTQRAPRRDRRRATHRRRRPG